MRKAEVGTARRSSLRRWGIGALAALAVLALVFYVGGGWYYANLLRDRALSGEQRRTDATEPDYDLTVTAIDEGSVTIERPEDPGVLLSEGVWGLEWDGGYGQVREILSTDGGQVAREFERLVGIGPEVDERVRLDTDAFEGDPTLAHGIPYREVLFEGELGSYPAWITDGDRDTWVIFVHGIGLSRESALRLLPALEREGYPTMTISYRNAPGAPEDPSGMLRYGATEWRDLEAAAGYALGQGATDLILAGHSMGGAVVMSFLYESELADEVSGVVLDAPMLDFGRTVDFGGSQETLPVVGLRVPQSLTSVAKWFAGWRFDVGWGAVDYLARADELSVPILLFHGTDDDVVPIELSEEFAGARPDLVTYRRIDGAEHVASWNVDPAAYERHVTGFLGSLAPTAAAYDQRRTEPIARHEGPRARAIALR